MNLRLTLAPAVAAATLLVSGAASAALMNGNDGSSNTSVFLSVVERNATNQAVRTLLIDTGARTLDAFAATSWSTTAAQETAILNFLASSTGTVLFNIGGGLNDQTFGTDLYGFVTTGNAAGPGVANFSQLGSAVSNIDTHIANANNGVFSPDGVLLAGSAINPGWHNVAWGATVGGAIETSNEVLFDTVSQVVGWRFNADTFEIVRSVLGPVSSNRATGDVTFVPVPAAVWLLGSALGLLSVLRRRSMA